MSRITLAVDNGSSGSMALIGAQCGTFFEPTPTMDALMGKTGKVIKRVAWQDMLAMLKDRIAPNDTVTAYCERPFTGSALFIGTMLPAQRAYEATLIVLEMLGIGYETVDSRQWQKAMLGEVKGSAALKKASAIRGATMFPAHAKAIKEHGDADSLLMAQYYHNQSK